MELLFNPQIGNDRGKLLPVPARMRKFISPWASAFYYEYPFGYGLIQEFESKKFSIYIWTIHADAAGTLYPATRQPVIAIQAMTKGELPCVLAGFGEKVLKRSTYELFYVPASVNEAKFDPGDYESFHIELEPGFLENIAETYANARELLIRFNNASDIGIPMIAVSLNYVSRAIIKKIRLCDKTAGDLVIELHRYIVDLLSEYISDIREDERDRQLGNIHHKEILLEIKKEIISDPNIENQELSKLSKKYRIGLTELKKEFKLFFGETPAAFVRLHALEKAHYLITTTNETIEGIAYEVGYGFRSNFDKSFKKQFGYSPASLR